MTHVQFLCIQKLTGKGRILVAAKHNHREILAEKGAEDGGRIAPSRSQLNYVLRGLDTAAGVAGMAQSLMSNAGIETLRKDAVRALEIIFSLPSRTTISHRDYFTDSLAWADSYFQAPVISAVVHLDEAAPHCHVLLLPLVDGRMIGSDLMGGRARLKAMQADFHTQVGQRYGLTRQTAQKRHSAAIRRQATDSAFDVLEANSGLNGDVLRVLLEPHVNNPEPLMMTLGLGMPTAKIKGTFAGIMTKPCKPEKDRKPIGFSGKKPIGFVGNDTAEKHQTLSCVGFQLSPAPIPADEPQQSDSADSYQRISDNETRAGYWDEIQGEWIPIPAKPSNKLTAVIPARHEVTAANSEIAARTARRTP